LPPPYTLFFISPANLRGERAALLFNPRASFPLAQQLRTALGAPLGDVYAFVSGLYFRGKKTYAEAFGKAPAGLSAGLVISPSEGLRFLYEPVTLARLQSWADVSIDEHNVAFTEPLIEHAAALDRALGESARFVLLGSVATDKYVEPLGRVFGRRLLFPPDFIGRGDMSRGSLMLQAARVGQELAYGPIQGAERRGRRAAGVSPTRRASARSTPGASALAAVNDADALNEEATATGEAPELVILVGLPGAGKSTFVQQRFAASHTAVSRDALRRSRQPERRQEELIQRALRAGESVVVDNTNVTLRDRAALIALARTYGARVSVYLFEVNARECVARNAGREGVARIPPIAIFAAAKRLVRPDRAEGFAALFLVRPLPELRFEVVAEDLAPPSCRNDEP
jgi:predicted kinase